MRSHNPGQETNCPLLGTVRLMEGGAITWGTQHIVLMLGRVRLMEEGAITWGRRHIVLMLGRVRLMEGGAITRGKERLSSCWVG